MRGSGPGATRIVTDDGVSGTSSTTTAAFAEPLLSITSHPFSTGDRVKVSGASGTGWATIDGLVLTVSVFGANAIFLKATDGSAISVSGWATSSSTNITVTKLNHVFQCEEAIFSDLTFVNCGIAIERTGGSGLSRLENVFSFNCDQIFKGRATGGGIQIMQNCNSTGGSNTQFECRSGTIFAVLNCFFNLPNLDGTVALVKHTGGRFALRDTIFDGTTLASNPINTCLEIDFADNTGLNPCELSSNEYFNTDKAIKINNDTGIIFSNGETIYNCTTSIEVETGYTGSYNFNGLVCDSSTFDLNGNEEPQNFLCYNSKATHLRRKTTEHTASGAISPLDTYVIANSASDITLDLPTAAIAEGREITIKNINTGVVTVDGDGSETIDDDTTQDLNQYDAMKIVSDGTEWWVV